MGLCSLHSLESSYGHQLLISTGEGQMLMREPEDGTKRFKRDLDQVFSQETGLVGPACKHEAFECVSGTGLEVICSSM